MTTSRVALLRHAEVVLVHVEEAPWAQFYRMLLGFWLVPGTSVLTGDDPSGWRLGVCQLMVLVGLRLGPAVTRKLVPFSSAPRQRWAKRRQMAKRYDSYQWQKLFWFGVGLTAYLLVSGNVTTGQLLLALLLLTSGAAGLVTWHLCGAPTEPDGFVRSRESIG
jgi:hypothetical protein